MRILIIIIWVLQIQVVFTQGETETKNRNTTIIGIYPSNIDEVNGLMLNFWPRDINQSDLEKGNIKLPTTNGVELNLNPLGPFAAVVSFWHFLLDSKSRMPLRDTISDEIIEYYKRVNGIQVSLLNIEPTIMNGIEIQLAGSYDSIANGVSIGIVGSK